MWFIIIESQRELLSCGCIDHSNGRQLSEIYFKVVVEEAGGHSSRFYFPLMALNPAREK